MQTFNPPIPLAADLSVTAHDGASYVLSDGRTFWASAPAEGATPETIAAEVEALIANPPLPPTVTLPPHRILKDTIVQRVKAAGKLSDLRAIIGTLDPDQRFEWDSSTWFHSDNALIVNGVAGLNLDPAVILANDPLAP